MLNNVAIITARGGSKRIPRKNIKQFLGKPIIAYSIEVAINSKLFDYIMVSTDDIEIGEIAKHYGANVPFLRSAKNADDFSGTADVILEVLNELKAINLEFKNTCCLYPTAPFISVSNLSKAYELLINKQLDSCFPVCQFSYPIQRALKFNTEQNIEMILPENIKKRSQDLMPSYHDAGQFYWLSNEKFLHEKKLFTSKSSSIILNELEVQDIDNETDWKLAELKYQLLNAQ